MTKNSCTCELRPKGSPVYTDFRKGGSLVFGLALVQCPLCKAAPDLLAACELALLAFEDRSHFDWSILEKAIAKARDFEGRQFNARNQRVPTRRRKARAQS